MRITRRAVLSMLGGLGASRLLSSTGSPPPTFEEIPPSSSGITWVHDNAMSPMRYLPETMGPGCAFLDYDNDGWMDIYLVNYGKSSFYTPPKPIRSALYRNNRDGTFTDVTDKAGVGFGGFGMGVAVGDYDNDGYPDMFVSAYGAPALFHNNRDGTFTNVAEKAGLHAELFKDHWSTSAVWFDFDNDGRLDLFVCSFVDYGAAHMMSCGDNKLGKHFYCIPRVFNGTASLLFHNNGDGTFTEVSGGTDIAKSLGKSLGVVATDVNNDGRMDLFVANDTVQDFLFMNRGPDAQGRTRWEEVAMAANVAYSDNGQARSGMGVDAADVDGDGYQDLFVANVDQEMFSLYRNNHDESFTDIAHRNDVANSTRLLSGWGLRFFDYDNDGRLDLFLANGHPDDMIDQYSAQVKYKEPLLLFHNENGKLVNVSADSGPVFTRSFPARGLALGDYNNDGRVDVLIGNNGGPPVLLKNNAGANNHWLGIKLVGVTCNRDAVGARIRWVAGSTRRSRLKNNGGSYLSSHDPREVIGLGDATKVDYLEIEWPGPSKHVEKLTNLPVDRYITIEEG
ncbi:MAG TPA: CRTAC1 family protein, partial [Bryobacteraceae bacterium]|nr:CRTAC1 family protein [Bryobacteraceae bacterium]